MDPTAIPDSYYVMVIRVGHSAYEFYLPLETGSKVRDSWAAATTGNKKHQTVINATDLTGEPVSTTAAEVVLIYRSTPLSRAKDRALYKLWEKERGPEEDGESKDWGPGARP